MINILDMASYTRITRYKRESFRKGNSLNEAYINQISISDLCLIK